MNLHYVDWAIVAIMLTCLFALALITKKYTLTVSDFLAANRCAGRYLLTVSNSMAIIGAITIIANFERYFTAGYPSFLWYALLQPITMIIALSGWVAYRYRQTRAMTMGQFFEMRYSRKFRIFAGIVAWVSGVLNYGIFPAISSRFIIYFCWLPKWNYQLAGFNIDITLGIVMIIFLTIAYWISSSGGQIAVIVTDFFQGHLLNFVFLGIFGFIAYKIGIGNIINSLKTTSEGHSMLDPFGQSNIKAFTWLFFVLLIFRNFYGVYAWQGNQGYYCSAKNAHEARMSQILAQWRMMLGGIVTLCIPLTAYVIMNNPEFAEKAAAVKSLLSQIPPEQSTQLTVPAALIQILPVGFMGLFCILMIAATISTDDTSLHSWGTLFIQDVYLPLSKKNQDSLTTVKHLGLLRKSMFWVAVFAWLFSMVFPLRDFIFMFFQITGAVYIGGAGIAIIGGLYWSKGTKEGAWAGMLSGMTLAVTSILLQNIFWVPANINKLREVFPDVEWIGKLPETFPINGMRMTVITCLTSTIIYVLFSLFTKKDPDFCLDKVLHRGKFARDEDNAHMNKKIGLFQRLSGISNEFTLFDKIIYYGTFAWVFGAMCVYITLLVYAASTGSNDEFWAKCAKIHILTFMSIGTMVTLWLFVGGIKDFTDLWRTLKSSKRNELDNGSVIGHQLADEIKPVKEQAAQ